MIKKDIICNLGLHVINEEVSIKAGHFGCNADTFPFNYIVFSLGGNLRCSSFWNPTVDKLKAKLANWTNISISGGGRLALTSLEYLSIFLSFHFQNPCQSGQILGEKHKRLYVERF